MIRKRSHRKAAMGNQLGGGAIPGSRGEVNIARKPVSRSWLSQPKA
jgi:hypothetical protein